MATKDLTFRLVGKDVSAGKTFDKVGRKADGLGKKFGALGAGLAGGALAAGALQFGKASVTAFTESEAASARLSDALARFPLTADKSRASFDKLNESLSKKTRFDDDATASGQGVLAQFKLTGKQIQEMTPLLQDYAAKTGKDLPTAAEELGKAIMGQTRPLKEIGLDLKDTGTEAGNLEQLMGGLRNTVGGFAETEGKTAAGQAAILGNQFGELQEQVGAKLVPTLMKLGEHLLATIDFIDRNSKVIMPLAGAVGGFAVTLMAVNKAIAVYNVVAKAMGVSTTIALGPIGIAVIAIGALALGIAIAWKKSETFRDVVTAAFRTVGGFVLTVIDKWLLGYQKLAEAGAALPGPLGAPFQHVAEKIGEVRGKIADLQYDLENLGKKTFTVRVHAVGDSSFGKAARSAIASRLDRLDRLDGARAAGGPVSAGGAYLVGERGPEVFTPHRSGSIVPNHRLGAGNVNLALTVQSVLDGRVVATSTVQHAQRMKINGRRVGLA